MRTQLVVALDAESRVSEGEEAELWFDPRGCTCSTPRRVTTSHHGHGVDSPALALGLDPPWAALSTDHLESPVRGGRPRAPLGSMVG